MYLCVPYAVVLIEFRVIKLHPHKTNLSLQYDKCKCNMVLIFQAETLQFNVK